MFLRGFLYEMVLTNPLSCLIVSPNLEKGGDNSQIKSKQCSRSKQSKGVIL